MEIVSILISASITMVAFGLLVVSLASYRKHQNLKLLFISLVFVILFIKGILLSVLVLFPEINSFDPFLTGIYIGVFDLIVLLLLFVATLKS